MAMNRRSLCLCLPAWALVACSTPRVNPPPADAPPVARADGNRRHDVVLQALAMLDRNYSFGGKRLHTGFDCSGLVSFVYRESAGLRLGGSSADLARLARPVPREQVQPGDLAFFNTLGPAFSHVGIYVGENRFVHAENEKTGVKTSSLSSRYWAQRFEGFRTLF